ncbi:hypothetical protein Dsin_022384 [Dipteronia sinensis]|uniref:Uncharacterized protein n=1 Tax=Dipteronia sinensis TaxID=43782 RepID=A0AAE0E004_9ROSI|nr:hypothetical protein Dsin_022384 [Dipteronia sinensis]
MVSRSIFDYMKADVLHFSSVWLCYKEGERIVLSFDCWPCSFAGHLQGAFAAGNDAGRAYNTFPKMGDTWILDDILNMKPLIRNFFENTSTVHLDHCILATTTLFSIGALWLATKKLDIHPAIRSLIGSTVGMAALQVTLGISTLLSYVQISLGSAHQAGALTLMILLNHTVRKPSTSLLKSLPQVAKTII